MAPRTWSPSTYATIHDGLIACYGPACAICHAIPSEPLAIDHLDRDRKNRTWANLRLLCDRCNNQNRSLRGINESVSERQLTLGEKVSPTEAAKNEPSYSNGSSEMRLSSFYELSYRRWVIENQPMDRTDAIHAGAETIGCSVETATRYLAKLTSKAGPLQTIQNEQGHIAITTRQTPEKGAPHAR